MAQVVPGCILFDYDLTLFDLQLDRTVVLRHFRRATEALGISETVVSWRSAFGAYRYLVDDHLVEDPDRDRMKRRLDEAMAAGEYEALPRVVPLPGVKDALSCLTSRDFRMGIVSSNSIRVIEAVSKKFHVWRFFDAVWGRESYGRSKPAPDKLVGCLRQLGCGRGLYVGDDPSDMDASVAAGCMGIGVIRVTDRLPTPSPAELRDRGAVRIVWGVRDLPDVLEGLQQGRKDGI